MGKSARCAAWSAVAVAVLVATAGCAGPAGQQASASPTASSAETTTTSTTAATTGTSSTDTSPPKITWLISSVATDNWDLSAAWGSTDADSGVDYTTARWRSRPFGGGWSPWHQPEKWTHLPARAQVTMHLQPGSRYEISAQVVDKAGNRSPWETVGGAGRPRR